MMHDSSNKIEKDDEIIVIINEISKLNNNEKKLLLLLMELIYIEGSIKNSLDLNIREYWLNKLKSISKDNGL